MKGKSNTYGNMMLINEVQNNSTHVTLLTLSSIPNLSDLIIWILWLLNIEKIDC
jgi:hypothetical protein